MVSGMQELQALIYQLQEMPLKDMRYSTFKNIMGRIKELERVSSLPFEQRQFLKTAQKIWLKRFEEWRNSVPKHQFSEKILGEMVKVRTFDDMTNSARDQDFLAKIYSKNLNPDDIYKGKGEEN